MSPGDLLAFTLTQLSGGDSFIQNPNVRLRMVTAKNLDDGEGFVMDTSAAGQLFLSPARLQTFEETQEQRTARRSGSNRTAYTSFSETPRSSHLRFQKVRDPLFDDTRWHRRSGRLRSRAPIGISCPDNPSHTKGAWPRGPSFPCSAPGPLRPFLGRRGGRTESTSSSHSSMWRRGLAAIPLIWRTLAVFP